MAGTSLNHQTKSAKEAEAEQSRAEASLISAVLNDVDSESWSKVSHLPPDAFLVPDCRRIWQALRDGAPSGDILAISQKSGLSVGSVIAYTEGDRTGVFVLANAGVVMEALKQRRVHGLALRMREAEDFDVASWKAELDAIDAGSSNSKAAVRSLVSFEIPAVTDETVLLGNRYLNRGDGAILASTSGMGKSSLTIQAATTWAIGEAFFGIKPNGPLRSLIIQAEDSDGDVAEVKESVFHGLQLSAEQKKQVEGNVQIVTDRTHRGTSFIQMLRGLVRDIKPDLVWINPLLAFMDGDVNDAKDAGKFLREGLNGLNEPAKFAYIVVHHTSKPPSAKDRGERRWNETMYDMAGSADFTNWARAVLSLRATDTEGEFNLLLAKRGRRAGIVREVDQGAGRRLESVTKIPLKHASGSFDVPETGQRMPLIFWEGRPFDDQPVGGEPAKVGGRPKKYSFVPYATIFPAEPAKALGFRPLWSLAKQVSPIGNTAFQGLLDEAVDLGILKKPFRPDGVPTYWKPVSVEAKSA